MIYIYIDKIVQSKLPEILEKGAAVIVAGNNGPYYNSETEVRNLAHYCVIFAEYYKHTGDEKYASALRCLADAILVSKHYNGQGVYKCREGASDEVNGVIGPAWIIEGLISAANALSDDKYYDRAVEIFKAVPFNYKLSLWNRRNTENKELSVDVTFNHQLWLAAAGSMICSYKKDEEINRLIDIFMDKLPRNLHIRKDGRIAHFTASDGHGVIISHVARVLRDMKSDIFEKLSKPSMAYKEAGYHCFSLYGFAILAENGYAEHKFFETYDFKKSLKYVMSMNYVNQLTCSELTFDATKVKTKLNTKENIFAFAYNSPAFELHRVFNTFNAWDENSRRIYDILCEKQLGLTFDNAIERFNKNTDDPVTLNARIYELIAGNEEYWEKIV